jgi:hypothetical protein
LEGGYALILRRRDAQRHCPQQGANGVNRHAERTLPPATVCVRPERGRHGSSQAMCNNEPNRSQRTNQDFDTQAKNQPLFTSLLDEAYIGSGENGKRYRRHQPASQPLGTGLPVLILTVPNNPFRHSCRATRLQLRCNPSSRKNVRTRFPTDFAFLAGPVGTPLCKISF